ncbi:MAG: DsrH/TusB family sulfur metabolism protein [Pseudomonadales bacterium]
MTDRQPNHTSGPRLHLIFSAAGYAAARPRGNLEDTWVLIGDGVYALSAADLNEPNSKQPTLHVLEADLAQRGVQVPANSLQVVAIDDLALVDLISSGQRTVSWR